MHGSLWIGETGFAVARLVARLDGMPLAIELAAARVEALGVTQLLDRLDDRFELLAGGDRLAAGRHRSPAAAVAWSYRLLYRQRAAGVPCDVGVPRTVHAGCRRGCGREERRPGGAAAGGMLVAGLAGGRPGWPSRYRMLETLRAYGGRLLAEAGERDDTAAVLAAHALQVAEEAEQGC